jgi:hypothetical protein
LIEKGEGKRERLKVKGERIKGKVLIPDTFNPDTMRKEKG